MEDKLFPNGEDALDPPFHGIIKEKEEEMDIKEGKKEKEKEEGFGMAGEKRTDKAVRFHEGVDSNDDFYDEERQP